MAWLFAGNTRTFGLPFVHTSIRQNGIESFGGEASTFFFRKLEEEQDPGGMNPTTVDDPGLEEAVAALNCTRLVAVHALSSSTPLNAACSFMPGNPTEPRNVGQMQAQASVYELLLAEEAQRGYRFDVIMHARPDVAWLAPLPPWTAWPLSGSRGWYPGLDYGISPSRGGPDPALPAFPPGWTQNCFEGMPTDMFALLTRPAASVFYSAYERYQKCSAPFPPQYSCCGGGVTALWMELMKSSEQVDTWARWPFPIMLIRRAFVGMVSDMCTQSYGSWAGDWMQRCAQRPVPGCSS